MLILFFVKVIRRVGGRAQAALGWQFSFQIDVCKIEIIMCDTVRLNSILKLVRNLMKENLEFQMNRVFFSKKMNLSWLREYLVFIGFNWMNSHAMNKCFVKKYLVCQALNAQKLYAFDYLIVDWNFNYVWFERDKN